MTLTGLSDFIFDMIYSKSHTRFGLRVALNGGLSVKRKSYQAITININTVYFNKGLYYILYRVKSQTFP